MKMGGSVCALWGGLNVLPDFVRFLMNIFNLPLTPLLKTTFCHFFDKQPLSHLLCLKRIPFLSSVSRTSFGSQGLLLLLLLLKKLNEFNIINQSYSFKKNQGLLLRVQLFIITLMRCIRFFEFKEITWSNILRRVSILS